MTQGNSRIQKKFQWASSNDGVQEALTHSSDS